MKTKKFNWWYVYIGIILVFYIYLAFTRNLTYFYNVELSGSNINGYEIIESIDYVIYDLE